MRAMEAPRRTSNEAYAPFKQSDFFVVDPLQVNERLLLFKTTMVCLELTS